MVKALSLSSHNLAAKVFWGTLVGLAGLVVLFSAYQSLFFSTKQWLIFVVTGIIGLIISQYQIKLPKKKGYISIREIVLFWAMIWLGASGSVLLALLAALGNYRHGSKNPMRWTVDISLISLTTFVSGTVLYEIVNKLFGVTANPIADNPINALVFLGVLVMAGGVHYGFYAGLYSLFLKLEGGSSIAAVWREHALVGSLFAVLCVGFVFGFHLLIVFFGLFLGLLVLPLVILAHLAFSFHKQLLEQKTKEIREASRIHLATVEALATAIDARDQVGRGHVSRTQIYAVGIGKVMNLSNDELEALNTGALLHDIGKLAVPDHILNKPGRLTPAEMEKTKIHSSVGASILEKIGFPYPVVPTVRHHHERWDGTGYPDALGKENIPLTARVLAVADAYDTLRGARPYRKAVSRDDARKFLITEAGKQFDPRIIDIFLRNLRTFEDEVVAQGLAYIDDTGAENPFETGAFGELDSSYVEQIKRANREVFTLYELARVFGASLNLEETMTLFVKKISELVPFDTCAVYLLSETETVAIAKYVAGKNKEELKNRKVQVGQGATGYALKKRQSVFNVNPGLDFSFYQMEFIQDYTAMASLPLIANEKLVGAVSLYTSEIESYEDEHMRLLETVSRIASDAILTSLRHAETETRALTDPMTSLPNARSLQMQFEKEIARASRNASSFQVLMLDLDGFKQINDTYGHKVGDKLLREISRVMQKQLRDYDFLARYAGDEFVAIIPETNNKAVFELCHRLEKAVREFRLDVGNGRTAQVGVSLGAASYPHSGETLDNIIIAADKAMYAVKARRKAKLKKMRMAKIEAQKKLEETTLEAKKPISVQEVSVETPNRKQRVEPVSQQIERIDENSLIVELDESHIISSKAIN
jgi:diguanylate cyclase (GGDEF)-like protein/putative nucleotidyltransferase with HDIG domain